MPFSNLSPPQLRVKVDEGHGLHGFAIRGAWQLFEVLVQRKGAMRTLIAEDDCALSMFLARGLEADGHWIELAQDGGTAIAAFRHQVPDLTILDLNLPVKDGEQVLSEIRDLDSESPVLVLTGRHEVDTRVRCLDHGD